MEHKPSLLLNTPRLLLSTPIEDDSEALKAFEDRNAHHLSPWRSSTVGPPLEHKEQLLLWEKEFEEKKSVRLFLFLKEQPECRLIGICNFSQIFRGPFQACYLGYQLDSAYEGKGLMFEAVTKAIQHMFEKENIHRIMANYMPSNLRSAKLLEKLGFSIEGHAKNYLLINDHWEDHVLTSLTNAKWNPSK